MISQLASDIAKCIQWDFDRIMGMIFWCLIPYEKNDVSNLYIWYCKPTIRPENNNHLQSISFPPILERVKIEIGISFGLDKNIHNHITPFKIWTLGSSVSNFTDRLINRHCQQVQIWKRMWFPWTPVQVLRTRIVSKLQAHPVDLVKPQLLKRQNLYIWFQFFS